MASSSNPKSDLSPAAAAEMATKLIASGINPLSLETILQSVTPSDSVPTNSEATADLVKLEERLEELRTDSSTQRRAQKGPSVAARSAGKRTRKTAPPSARKSQRTTPSSVPPVEEEGESEEGAEESEEAGRVFAQELVLNNEWLVENSLGKIVELLEAQGWGALFRKPVVVDEKLVRDFYSKLKVLEKEKGKGNWELSAVVSGDSYSVSMRELATVLGVPKGGYATYSKGTWPGTVAKAEVFERLGLDPSAKGQRENTHMDVLPRILHRILVSNISPRRQKHNLVTFQDLLLVDQILQKKPVNLAFQVMKHMENNRDNPSNGLPFPGFVKEILKYWEVYQPESEKVLSSALCHEHIAKLGLEFSVDIGWTVPAVAEEDEDEDVIEVTPINVTAPICDEPSLLSESTGELLALLKVLRAELKEVKSELKEVRSELLDARTELTVVKEKMVALEVAITVDSGAMSVAVAGFPEQMKDLAAEIVEQMKASFTIETSS